MTSQQHRLAAMAMVLSAVISGIGCQDKQATPQPKPAPAKNTDAGGKTVDAGNNPSRDAGAPDVPAGKPDAGTTPTGAGGTIGTPPTTGKGGTGGTTAPPPTGTGGTTAPPPTGTGGTAPPPTGTGGTTAPPPTVVGPSTPPTTTPPATPLRIAAFGDYGVDNSHEADVAALVHGWKPDHVLTTGDNNYSSGEAATIDQNIGKHYHDFIGNYRGSYGAGSATNRFWPSPGNHDWVAADLKPYTDYFTLPGNERYYDVDLGLVHLYAVDSDSDEPDGITATSKQALWLKEKLAASKSCFDLVYFHHPPYSTGDEGGRANLRWPFEEWGAESVLVGHDHHYERLQIGGIPYFVVGTGGAGRKPFDKPALPETKFRDADTYGAMLITASTSGITFEFWSQDGKKLDSFSVPKSCPPR